MVQEQFYIMKSNEIVTRSFKLYPTTDQAARYVCSGIVANWFEHTSMFLFPDPYSQILQILNRILSLYLITAILKDSDFSEVDRAECQFTTTATVIDNGSQVG